MYYKIIEQGRLQVDTIIVSTYKSRPYYDNNKALSSFIQHFKDETVGVYGVNDKAIKWFVTNTTKAVRNNSTAMSIKLAMGYWSGNVCGIGYRGVKSLVSWLEANDYVDVYIGYTEYWKPVKDRKAVSSILVFKEKLLSLFMETPLHLFVKKGNLEDEIVNKDRKTKEKISTRNLNNVKQERTNMKTYNKSLAGADIKFRGKPVATVEYFRSFSGDSDSGGRLYVNGGGVQLVAEKYRSKYLTFGDEEVVELDYSSIHPSLLYEKKNLTCGFDVKEALGEGFKPYNAYVQDFIKVDQIVVEKHKLKYGIEEYDPIRALCKVVLLISLNSKTLESAAHAISFEICSDRKQPLEHQSFVGITKTVDTIRICKALMEHNSLIAEHFFNDDGIKLQNVDSHIAWAVVNTLLQNDEIILCYHDSFIVRKSAEKILEVAMQDAWEYVVGGKEFCRIEKKIVATQNPPDIL